MIHLEKDLEGRWPEMVYTMWDYCQHEVVNRGKPEGKVTYSPE